MCRFLLYLGPEIDLADLITEPSHSLVHQSHHAELRAEPLNGDGFGVAWYAPRAAEQAAAFRSITPAWNNRNLHDLCRVTRSRCVLAHVRAASPGLPVAETNCHPFVQGPLTFMHNGHLGGFPGLNKRTLLRDLSDDAFASIGGTTDSEHVFALFQDCYREEPTLSVALRKTIERLRPHMATDQRTTLNLAVTDGERAAISRFSAPSGQAESLYVHQGKRYVCQDGVGRMQEPDAPGSTAVIVSSEPVSADPGWDAVPADHLVVVASDGSVDVQPL